MGNSKGPPVGGEMSRPVELLAGADSDLQEIFDRYEESREGRGEEFLFTFEAYLARIAVFPEIAPLYFKRVRRQVIAKFPYGIYYEPHPTRIVVIALIDLRQSDEQILRRLRL
jgi:hypothetical protein